jgi:hypothetical protein
MGAAITDGCRNLPVRPHHSDRLACRLRTARVNSMRTDTLLNACNTARDGNPPSQSKSAGFWRASLGSLVSAPALSTQSDGLAFSARASWDRVDSGNARMQEPK